MHRTRLVVARHLPRPPRRRDRDAVRVA